MANRKRNFKSAFKLEQDDSRSISSGMDRASCVSTKSIKDALRDRGIESVSKTELKRLKTAVFHQRAAQVDQARRADVASRSKSTKQGNATSGFAHSSGQSQKVLGKKRSKDVLKQSERIDDAADLKKSDDDFELSSEASNDRFFSHGDRDGAIGAAKPSVGEKKRRKRAAKRTAQIDALRGALDAAKNLPSNAVLQRAIETIQKGSNPL